MARIWDFNSHHLLQGDAVKKFQLRAKLPQNRLYQRRKPPEHVQALAFEVVQPLRFADTLET